MIDKLQLLINKIIVYMAKMPEQKKKSTAFKKLIHQIAQNNKLKWSLQNNMEMLKLGNMDFFRRNYHFPDDALRYKISNYFSF